MTSYWCHVKSRVTLSVNVTGVKPTGLNSDSSTSPLTSTPLMPFVELPYQVDFQVDLGHSKSWKVQQTTRVRLLTYGQLVMETRLGNIKCV